MKYLAFVVALLILAVGAVGIFVPSGLVWIMMRCKAVNHKYRDNTFTRLHTVSGMSRAQIPSSIKC
ncbi:MAG: hypothetical protein ABSA46_18290 [Thermodesulfovibrionales bacterium]